MQCKAYLDHPVLNEQVHRLHKHWSDVEVISLFCDGVSYTKRDSFIGFYLRNMRTGAEEMSFVIRT